MNGVGDEPVEKLYWFELHQQVFHNIISDLKDRLDSTQYKVSAQIEKVLLDGITKDDADPITDLVEEVYGVGVANANVPFVDIDTMSNGIKYILV